MFDYIKQQNDAGYYYPVWGICLGYEYMVGYTAQKGFKAVEEYPLDGVSLPLEFISDYKDTIMFGGLKQDDI